jgi:hypothetical protein
MKGARIIVPGVVVALLLATALNDHYFRDEFYYLACSRRLAWGYVDQPPLSIAILWLVRHVAGTSLIALRVVAALTLAAAILVTGSIARRLGGGALAAGLAMTTLAIAPIVLAIGSFYSMNVFDLLIWTVAIRVFIDCLEAPRTDRWIALGVMLGLGLLNKISILWLGAGFGAALLLTPSRRHLLTRGPYLAALIAAVMFLPHVLWQAAHAWPTLEFIRNAGAVKMQVTAPLSFLAAEITSMHPIALPIWAIGLAALLVHPRLRRYRALAIVFLTVACILILNRTSRAEYLTPAFPPLVAAGAVLIEWSVRARVWRGAIVAAVVICGALTVPLAVPILPTGTYVRYARALGVTPSTEERKEVARLPQFFADRQGWDALVDQVTAAWHQLTPSERAHAAVLTGNYGEAGAIELLRTDPRMIAISGHNNYWLWGPMGSTGNALVVLSRNGERLRSIFTSVQPVGETHCGDCMPYENGLPIYLCRGLRIPMTEFWMRVKHFE